jgi:hypothetical protein
LNVTFLQRYQEKDRAALTLRVELPLEISYNGMGGISLFRYFNSRLKALRIAGFVSAILRRGVEEVELAEETDYSGNTDLQTVMSKWLEKANQTLVIKTRRNLSIRSAKRVLTRAVFNRKLFLTNLAVGLLGFALKRRRPALLLSSSTNTKPNDISTNTFAKGVEGSR